jgi:hypothetical protein
MEWALSNHITFITGAHAYREFGFDGSLTINIPLRTGTFIFLGGDADINVENSITMPVWAPVGIEAALSSGVSIILEGNVAVTAPAYHILGLGIGAYL